METPLFPLLERTVSFNNNNKTNYKSIVLFYLIKIVNISFCCTTWHVTIGPHGTQLVQTFF